MREIIQEWTKIERQGPVIIVDGQPAMVVPWNVWNELGAMSKRRLYARAHEYGAKWLIIVSGLDSNTLDLRPVRGPGKEPA